MFITPDAQSYRSVGDWLLGSQDIVNPLIRPFLYPLLLVIARVIANDYGIWFFQFVLWLFSGVLVYRVIKMVTQNPYMPVIGIFLFASNITLLLLTLHALTEITTILIITILITSIINRKNIDENHYWLLIIFLLSLLVLLKPLFFPLWVILLTYRVVTFIHSMLLQQLNWKYLSYIVISVLPVLLQLLLMTIKFNEFTVSNIGSEALKTYYFARVYGEVNSIPVEQARMVTTSYGQGQIFRYLLSHIDTSAQIYIKTISENLLAKSNFIIYPKPNIYLSTYMRLLNIVYFIMHVVMIPASIIAMIRLYKKKYLAETQIILSLIVLLLFIFFTSGITYWQGDRIILPSLPVWLTLYSVVISKLRGIRKVHS